MRLLASIAAAVLALGLAPIAHADLWGYVDERGVAHFAPEQRDARYQLFFRGRSSLDPASPSLAASPTPADLLRDHPLFKRVTEHPNVARFAPLIEQHAKAYGLDAALVKAMVAVESAFDPAAVSPKGAVGLMQVMPATGERYGVAADRTRTVAQKLADPALNVRIGTRYMRDLLQRFDQDTVLALAAYNAGEGAVEQYDNQMPPYPETRAYVQLVQRFRDLYEPPVPVRAPASTPARVTIPPSRKARGDGSPAS